MMIYYHKEKINTIFFPFAEPGNPKLTSLMASYSHWLPLDTAYSLIINGDLLKSGEQLEPPIKRLVFVLYRESCSQGSIVDLIQILKSRGFRWTCTNNDE